MHLTAIWTITASICDLTEQYRDSMNSNERIASWQFMLSVFGESGSTRQTLLKTTMSVSCQCHAALGVPLHHSRERAANDACSNRGTKFTIVLSICSNLSPIHCAVVQADRHFSCLSICSTNLRSRYWQTRRFFWLYLPIVLLNATVRDYKRLTRN